MLIIVNSILNNARLWQWLCALVAMLVCIIYLLALQPGHNWGDDFSQYIAHARNIVSGRPYKDIQFLENPFATIAPETYPMVFPVLLAPVYAIFGINLLAFKVLVVLCFAGALLLIWPVFRHYLPPYMVFLLTLLLAVNPDFFLFKENILSELPFLFFLLLSFYFMQKAMVVNNTNQSRLFWGLAGLSLFLVVGTRSAGIVLVPAWVGAVILRKDKLRNWLPHLGFSMMIFLGCYFLQHLYLNSSGESYTSQFWKVYNQDTISNNFVSYYQEAGRYWFLQTKPYFERWLLNLWLLLGLTGLFWRSIRRKPDVLEFFTFAYIALTIIWPWYLGFRMLIPLVVLLFFYAFYTVNAVFKTRKIVAAVFAFTLFLLWGIPYFSWYQKNDIDIGPGFLRPATSEMFHFISQMPVDTRIMFEKPRVIALYTGRAAMAKHCLGPDDVFAAFLKEMQLSVLVIPKTEFQPETGCLKRWIDRNPAITELQFENEEFAVYKYLP